MVIKDKVPHCEADGNNLVDIDVLREAVVWDEEVRVDSCSRFNTKVHNQRMQVYQAKKTDFVARAIDTTACKHQSVESIR